MGGQGGFVARSEALRGSRLGSYAIVRLVGHGATASVFEGIHVALGKPVAIKILHEHLADDEQVRNRFVREGRVAARLKHPNIVVVLDVGVEGTAPYLVMELLTGGDLRSLMADVLVLTPEHALGFLLPIASALAHAHDAGVVHRDLKPANIFLARDVRDDVVPKLVDFGLSKIASGEASSLTATELVAGTVLYMAPEQTLGVRHASPASDQYSFATILYECITGQPPFSADGVYALIERIRAGQPRPPSHVNPRLPEALDDVILRAMSHDPSRRYPSIRALGRALLPFASQAVAAELQRDFAEPAQRVAEERVTEPPSEPTPDVLVSSVRVASPLPCPPGQSPFHIKGLPYRGFVHLVGKTVPGGLDAFAAALDDPRLATFVQQPFLASARYDVLPLLPLFMALARVIQTPFETLVRETATAQVRYDARTAYQRVLSGASPAAITEKIGRFGAQYYDFGTFTGTNPEPGVTVIVHAGVPAYLQPWYLPMHVQYTLEVARLCGGTDVRVLSSQTVPDGDKDGFPLVATTTALHWKA
jgi:serine/threonine-protein kinase